MRLELAQIQLQVGRLEDEEVMIGNPAARVRIEIGACTEQVVMPVGGLLSAPTTSRRTSPCCLDGHGLATGVDEHCDGLVVLGGGGVVGPQPVPGEPLPLNRLSRCPMHEAAEALDDLTNPRGVRNVLQTAP